MSKRGSSIPSGRDVETEMAADARTKIGLQANIVNDGTKALLLINGGGAVVLLAWLNASLSAQASDLQRSLIGWLILSVVLFVLGSAASVFSFFCRYTSSVAAEMGTSSWRTWWIAWLGAVILSGVMFFAAVTVTLIGVILAYYSATGSVPPG